MGEVLYYRSAIGLTTDQVSAFRQLQKEAQATYLKTLSELPDDQEAGARRYAIEKSNSYFSEGLRKILSDDQYNKFLEIESLR